MNIIFTQPDVYECCHACSIYTVLILYSYPSLIHLLDPASETRQLGRVITYLEIYVSILLVWVDKYLLNVRLTVSLLITVTTTQTRNYPFDKRLAQNNLIFFLS